MAQRFRSIPICLNPSSTLWSEQPVYFQAAFVLYRVKAMATDYP
jgi:hypothetical protein